MYIESFECHLIVCGVKANLKVGWIESCEYEYASRMIHRNAIIWYIGTYRYQGVLLVVDIMMMDEL